jgi:hypothetical protein
MGPPLLHQNSTRNINWSLRGLLELVILPKVAGVVTAAAGEPPIWWFNRLKASARKLPLRLSRTGNFFSSAAFIS